MSATVFNPYERNVSPAGVLRRRSLSTVKSGAYNVVAPEPLSRSGPRGDIYKTGYSETSDDDLITGAQRGDQHAFEELCRRNSSMVKSKILKIVRNWEDAEDVLQDTLLRAYMHMSSFRRSCKFSTWLTTIAVNSALMMMRKRRVQREANAITSSLDTGTVELKEPVDRSPGPEGIYLRQQAILLVRREVEKLHPSLRSVVNHYYESDCSVKEAAKALDISLSATKSRLMRGRVRLRSSLEGYGIFKSRN